MNHIYHKLSNGYITTAKYDGSPINAVGQQVKSFYGEDVVFYNVAYESDADSSPIAFVDGKLMMVTSDIVVKKLLLSLASIKHHMAKSPSDYLHSINPIFDTTNYNRWCKYFDPIIASLQESCPSLDIESLEYLPITVASNEWTVFHEISSRHTQLDNVFGRYNYATIRLLMLAGLTLLLADEIEDDPNSIDPRYYPVLSKSYESEEDSFTYQVNINGASNKLYLL